MNTQKLMPVIFLGHGSPLSAFSDNEFTKSWRELGQKIERPKAIIIFSAHWFIEELKVTSSKELETIYDFYGFPPFMYEYDYKGHSDESLVQRIQELSGAQKDEKWGLDHGAWCLLKHMYPDGSIPVVQISIPKNYTVEEFKVLSEKLSILRAEGVLIVGSGNLTHNLRLMDRSDSARPFAWALEYDEEVKKLLEHGDEVGIAKLFQSEKTQRAHHGLDHIFPAVVSAFFKKDSEKMEFFNEKIVYGSLSMSSFIIS